MPVVYKAAQEGSMSCLPLSEIAASQKKKNPQTFLRFAAQKRAVRSAAVAIGRSCSGHGELEEAGRSQEDMRLSYDLSTKTFCCSFGCCPLY